MPVICALAAALLFAGCRDPDVVILSVDTLRADHVGALNPASPARTPNIDALAADGVTYTRAWTPVSVTGPAFCTVMTGQEPGRHGVAMNLFRGGATLPPAAETLAERLRDADYRTGAFVSGFTLRRALGLGQGFEVYDEPAERNRRGDATADAAIAWLAGQRGPLLLWYHSFDVHGPLRDIEGMEVAGPDWEREGPGLAKLAQYQVIAGISDPAFYRRRYAQAVEFADAQVGRVVAALREQGRYDRALIVFMADHGESFDERELWFDHGTTPYAEQARVPLVVKYPRGRGTGTRVDAMVALQDLAPTVLDVLDLPPLGQADGLPLAVRAATPGGILQSESSHCKKVDALSCRPWGPAGKLLAARDERWTLVRNPTSAGLRYELFDRRADPGERAAMLDTRPPEALIDAVDALASEREAMRLPLPPMLRAGEADEETQMLQSLGYVDGP